MWDEWDIRDGVKDDKIDFTAFYNGFMSPYFSCYRCDETKKALSCIDMDNNGKVDWKEFAVYLNWAIQQYPETKDAEELLSIAFRKGIVPAMQDEIIKERQCVHGIHMDAHERGNFYTIPEYEEDEFLGDLQLPGRDVVDCALLTSLYVDDDSFFDKPCVQYECIQYTQAREVDTIKNC